jgi:hypothetical protein
MTFNELYDAIDNRAYVLHDGRTGIALGYNPAHDTVKVGLTNADGTYSGESTKVPRTSVQLV